MLKVHSFKDFLKEQEESDAGDTDAVPTITDGEYHSQLADRLKAARNKNIVRYISIFIENSQLVFIEPYYTHGSLADMLTNTNSDSIGLELASKCTLSLLKALDYLHSNGMVHGHLRVSKIIICSNNGYYIRLADYQMDDVFNEVANIVVDGTFEDKA